MKELLEQYWENLQIESDVRIHQLEEGSRAPPRLRDPPDGSDIDDLLHPYSERQLTEAVVATMDGWLDDEYLNEIDNKLTTTYLDVLLLLLIDIRGIACGKELRQDLHRLFGADVSPGTVYPHLNDLADEGLLNMRELSKRNVYEIADREATRNDITTATSQLAAFSLVLMSLAQDRQTRQQAVSEPESE